MRAMRAATQAPITVPSEICSPDEVEELALAVGVDDAAAVDVPDTEEPTIGMPVGVELGSATAAVFWANEDAVGVGSLTTTEPESGR